MPVSATAKSAARCACIAAALVGASAARADTAAGTVIVNVAQLDYSAGSAVSNESRLIVAERLDVRLVAGPTTRSTDYLVATATLTNGGNGQEAFAVTAAGTASPILKIAVDSDGDGRYDPARDAELTAGLTPVLAPGQSVPLFVIVGAAATGNVTITAAAVTGTGEPGTTFPAAGDGGGDAVTGRTTARASVTVSLPEAGAAVPTLTKSATVIAPDGSARAVGGATITYTLVAGFPAATAAAQLSDPIPAGTAYTPASLTLDDAPLSDAADTDAGDATPARIAVALGDQPAGSTRTIRFKVVIQ